MYRPAISQEEFDVARARGSAYVEKVLMREKRQLAKAVSAQLRQEGVRFWTLKYWHGGRTQELIREYFLRFNEALDVHPYVMEPGLTIHGEDIRKAQRARRDAIADPHEDQRVYWDPVTREEFRADQLPMVALFDKHKCARLRVM